MRSAEDRWDARTRALRERFARHRVAWTLGFGLAAGFVAGLTPGRRITGVGRSLAGVLAFVLRSPIGTSLIARVMQSGSGGAEDSARSNN